MVVADWFNTLRARLWQKKDEQAEYRESVQSMPFGKWYCRGFEAAMDWVLEQAKEIHEIEQLKVLHSKE